MASPALAEEGVRGGRAVRAVAVEGRGGAWCGVRRAKRKGAERGGLGNGICAWIKQMVERGQGITWGLHRAQGSCHMCAHLSVHVHVHSKARSGHTRRTAQGTTLKVADIQPYMRMSGCACMHA